MKVNDLTDAQLVGVYIKLRDRRAQRRAAHDNEDADDKARQEKIEAVLLRRFAAQGVESVRTTAGTAYKATRTSATVADWDAFLAFVRGAEAWDMLEKRAAKNSVEQYKAANEDLPPGVNWREEAVINVRRA